MAVTFPATVTEPENYKCGSIPVPVKVTARLSHTRRDEFTIKRVDACLADIVDALVGAGIYTDGCCCGHGEARGSIILSDGRELSVRFPDDWEPHNPEEKKQGGM